MSFHFFPHTFHYFFLSICLYFFPFFSFFFNLLLSPIFFLFYFPFISCSSLLEATFRFQALLNSPGLFGTEFSGNLFHGCHLIIFTVGLAHPRVILIGPSLTMYMKNFFPGPVSLTL